MRALTTPHGHGTPAALIAGTLMLCMTAIPIHADESKHLRITEFMYDAEGADGGKEYVEIINTGPGDITGSAVKFSEHGRTRGIRGSAVLKPGDIAVIVSEPEKFSEHYPSFTGTLLDSANFSLNNTGSTLALLLNGETLHTVTYAKENGGNGDGTSLHVDGNGSLSARRPSPGAADGIPVDTMGGTSTDDGTTDREHTGEPTARQPASAETPPHPTARLITDPERIFLASVTSFTMERNDGTGKAVYGRWNFGDGTDIPGDTVTHAYLHPGTYIISFSEIPTTGRGRKRTEPDEPIRFRREITVRAPLVRAERIDGVFVRFHNDHPFTLDVSDWRILAGETRFVFPERSFIPARKSTVVSFTTPEHAELSVATRGGGVFAGRGTVATRPVSAGQSAARAAEPMIPTRPASVKSPAPARSASSAASSAEQSAASPAVPTARMKPESPAGIPSEGTATSDGMKTRSSGKNPEQRNRSTEK